MVKPGSEDGPGAETPVQLITGRDGKAAFAILPIEAFVALMKYARKGAAEEAAGDVPALLRTLLPEPSAGDSEDAEDVALYDAAKERAEESLPLAVVDRLIDGTNPIKVFREYRGLTQQKLAAEIATTSAYLSQIETGRRQGSLKLLHRLAAALEVDLDDLV